MVRIKSERELKWEQEHSQEIEESLKKMKEENYKEQGRVWRAEGWKGKKQEDGRY